MLSPPESNESNLSTTCFHGDISILSSVFIQGYHCFRLRPVPGCARGVGVWPCLWPCGVWSPGDLRDLTELYPLPVPVLVGTPKCKELWLAYVLQQVPLKPGAGRLMFGSNPGRIFDGSYHSLMVKLGWFTIALLSLLTLNVKPFESI